MSKNPPDAHIKVICRMRPLNELEKSQGGQCCVVYNQKTIKLKVQGDETNYEFSFDRIFGPETSQKEMFAVSAQSVVESVMNGYNGTIFAYGQTSSGKTFTMEGPSLESDEQKGIIPRMMDSVFNHIVNADENLEFTVKISFLEIYNEKIQDLLDPRKSNLHIKEDKSKGIFIQDATEVYVNSVENMKKVMKTGAENRTIAATRMNERSSRSHSIFILSIVQKDIRVDNIKQSKLYFVDLAGSEKISKTQVTGQQLEEAKNINKSLSALGNVINALTSIKPEHVPYRDSKLTRILQESLGGNSKTTLIIACSMCSYNDKETLSTFRFGNRAKSIKNKPIVNVERSAKELQQLLEAAEKTIKKQEELIQRLQMQLDNGSNVETTSVNSSIALLDNSNLIKLEKIEKGELIHNLSIDVPNENDLIKEFEGSLKESPKDDLDIKFKETNEIDNLKRVSKSNVTLTILKQHIHIVSINEEIKALKFEKKDLEAELLNKNKEIYELNEKLLNQEENYMTLLPKYENYLQKLQINLEQVYHENQTFSNSVFEIRTEMKLFKDELTNIMINKMLFNVDTPKNGGGGGLEDNEIINDKIQKILKMIEIIERFTDKFRGTKGRENFSTHCTQNTGDELTFTNNFTEEQYIKSKSSISEENHTGKSENLSAQLPKRLNKLPNKLIHILTKKTGGEGSTKKNSKIEEEKYVSTEPDEEKISERKDSFPKKQKNESLFKARVEADKSFNEILERLGNIENSEDKLIQLHELVVNQRKTIDGLSKVNEELTNTIDTNNNTIDSRILKFKSEINELSKYSHTRVKDYDKKIENLQKSIGEKQNEIKELKKKSEKEILQKNHQLCEIKVNFDKLQKIVNGNNNMKKVYDLEAKLRDLGTERQKLFNDLSKLRSECDQRDDIISEKDYHIHLLQNNINTLANQLDTLKFINDSQYNVCLNQQARVKELEDDLKSKMMFNSITSGHKSKKSIMNFQDKNIIKPIKGGGGDFGNFQRKNFLTNEKEGISPHLANVKRAESIGGKDAMPMVSGRDKLNVIKIEEEKKEEPQNTKRDDSMKKKDMQNQHTPSFFNNIKSFFQ